MSYNPSGDLKSLAILDAPSVGHIRSTEVRGWFQDTDALILDAQAGRFQVEGRQLVFDYPSVALPFKPSQTDTLTLDGKIYPIDRAITEGAGFMTKLTLGFPA